jgi:phosphoribosylformylglycinamidine synthase
MKIGVKIMPREVVLDTQGRAVENILKQHGKEVASCRVGRYVQLDLAESEEKAALAKAKELAEFVLHNPLIEQYELEVL